MRLLHPWDFPSKSTGVGCHCLLQCMKVKVKVKSLSPVGLLAAPWTAAHEAPPPMGFPRQECWSGVPSPSPMHESESEVAQSCPTLSGPMDCNPPGSSAHRISQARVLEWGAIAFSEPQGTLLSISYLFPASPQIYSPSPVLGITRVNILNTHEERM